MIQKVLFTGSREASHDMLEAVSRYINARIVGHEVLVIVGDADGVDETVIRCCDENEIPVEVHGAFNKFRRKTWTGTNVSHDTDYLGRDRIMANLLKPGDMCVAVWNGVSKESGTVATARYAGRSCHAVYWLWRKYES